MRTSQCPYFLGSCPLVSVSNADPPPPPPPPPTNPRPAPLRPNSYAAASGSPQLASPSLSSHHGFGPPSPSLQGASLGQPSLFERRKQYKAEMFKNQVERQGRGGGGGRGQQRSIPPPTSTSTASSSSSSSFPTSSYCLPASLSTNTSRDTSSEGSPILSYNPQPPYQSSVDFDSYNPSLSSSSSSNPFPLPFDENPLPSPGPYLFQNQNQSASSSGGFTDLLQLHTSPPVLFQQPQPKVDDDEYLSSSTASFPYSPEFYGGGDWQGNSYGSFEDGLVQPENASFKMEETPATRQEFVRVVESRPPREKPASSSSQVSQGSEEMLGEQTAFISKLWHVITHDEYAQYIRFSKDGRSFVLLDPDRFAAVVLPRFFRHSKLTSFVRQLNLYSFQRVSVEYLAFDAPTTSPYQSHQQLPPASGSPSSGKTVVASGFFHPSFQRDHPELLCQLHPRVPGKPKSSSRKDEKSGSKRSSATRGVGRS